MSKFVDKTRILIKVNRRVVRKLCDILVLRQKSNGEVYEYKITFSAKNYLLLKNLHFSGVKGVMKGPKEKIKYDGRVEVCYHSRGSISFKQIDNGKAIHFKKYKTKPFDKLGNYNLFLRISTESVNKLSLFQEKLSPEDELIKISELLPGSFSIDFYLSHRPIKLIPSSVFKDNYQFLFEEVSNNLFLLIHFYKQTPIQGHYLQIIENTLISKVKREFYYHLYLLRDWLKK